MDRRWLRRSVFQTRCRCRSSSRSQLPAGCFRPRRIRGKSKQVGLCFLLRGLPRTRPLRGCSALLPGRRPRSHRLPRAHLRSSCCRRPRRCLTLGLPGPTTCSSRRMRRPVVPRRGPGVPKNSKRSRDGGLGRGVAHRTSSTAASMRLGRSTVVLGPPIAKLGGPSGARDSVTRGPSAARRS